MVVYFSLNVVHAASVETLESSKIIPTNTVDFKRNLATV